MCFLYELLKVFFLKYCTRTEFMLCIVVQYPDAKTVGILEKNKTKTTKTHPLNFEECLGSLLLERVSVSSLSCLEWRGNGDKGAPWQSGSRRGLFWGYYG